MKEGKGFETYKYSITDKSRGVKLPSYDRVIVAVTVSAMLTVICAVMISLYGNELAHCKEYYATGVGDGASVYEDTQLYGGFTVIGEPITVLEFTETVERGERATVRIQGKPYTEYDITVYLKSGPSGNSALVPKKSNEYGVVEWEWQIYKGTSTGKFKVVVRSMIESNLCLTYAEMYLTVTDDGN